MPFFVSPSLFQPWLVKVEFFALLFFFCARTGVCAAEDIPESKRETPSNFIVIFTDDQGYQDLGCYGSPDIKTPRLDEMAREGMRFTDFYAQTVCGPSRAALMTGCYPLRLARQGDPNSIHPELHSKEITIAEALRPLGYTSGLFGKWDLAGHNPKHFLPELIPEKQGFEVSFWTPGSNDNFVDLYRGPERIESKAEMATLTRRYTDEALRFMEEQQNSPFFLYLAHTMPHTKLAASADFKGRSEGGLYGDVIEELDFQVGRILDKVRSLNLDQHTYRIFTSDNGPWLIRKENGGHAQPLRSGKTSCWEGGLRVPCIMWAPERIPAGTECSAITATIDLMPTLLSLAGGSPPDDRIIDGLDLSSVITGQVESLQRPFFYYQPDCLRAVRSGDWKLMIPATEPVKGSIATKWRKHIAAADAVRIAQPQLYNLSADIGEKKNVAAQHPQIVNRLTALAQKARHDIGDHDLFGKGARTFGAQARRLSPSVKRKKRDNSNRQSF